MQRDSVTFTYTYSIVLKYFHFEPHPNVFMVFSFTFFFFFVRVRQLECFKAMSSHYSFSFDTHVIKFEKRSVYISNGVRNMNPGCRVKNMRTWGWRGKWPLASVPDSSTRCYVKAYLLIVDQKKEVTAY